MFNLHATILFAVGMFLLFARLCGTGRTAPWSRKEAGLLHGSALGTGELVAQALFEMGLSLCLCPLFSTTFKVSAVPGQDPFLSLGWSWSGGSCIPHPSSHYGMLLAHQPMPSSDVSS